MSSELAGSFAVRWSLLDFLKFKSQMYAQSEVIWVLTTASAIGERLKLDIHTMYVHGP